MRRADISDAWSVRDMPTKKHVPIRNCVICKLKLPKKELLRLVRTADGRVSIDTSGRMNGRGCYLCRNPEHMQVRGAKVKIKRALKLEGKLEPELIRDLMKLIGDESKHTSN